MPRKGQFKTYCKRGHVRTPENLSNGKRSCKICMNLKSRLWQRDASSEYLMVRSAKARAKRQGIPFNLSVEDIRIPELCPVFGTRLECSTTGRYQDNSPSLDKLIPELGYVKGNVWVISFRANRIKGDCSLEELKQLVAVLQQKEPTWRTQSV